MSTPAAEYAVINAECSVMYFSQNTKQWVYASDAPSSGQSQVELFKKGEDRDVRYRIVGRLKSDSMVVINSVLYVGMEYRKATDTFHQWQDSRFIYGLCFESAEEAEGFATAVDHAIITIGKFDAQKKAEEKAEKELRERELLKEKLQEAEEEEAEAERRKKKEQEESKVPPLVSQAMGERKDRRRSSIAYVPQDVAGAEKDVLPPPPSVAKGGRVSRKSTEGAIPEEQDEKSRDRKKKDSDETAPSSLKGTSKTLSTLSLNEIPSASKTKKKGTSNLSEELQELKKEIIAEMRAELEEFKRELFISLREELRNAPAPQ